MKFEIKFPVASLGNGEVFRIDKTECLVIGRWRPATYNSQGERKCAKWFDTELTIENVDFRELLDTLAQHLGVKILEDEEESEKAKTAKVSA